MSSINIRSFSGQECYYCRYLNVKYFSSQQYYINTRALTSEQIVLVGLVSLSWITWCRKKDVKVVLVPQNKINLENISPSYSLYSN